MTVLERRSDGRGARNERAIIRIRACQISSGKEDYIATCETRDVSVSGLSAVIQEALPTNIQVEVWMEIKGFQQNFLLSGVVRWCHQEPTQWVCGIEFQAEPPLDIQGWRALFS